MTDRPPIPLHPRGAPPGFTAPNADCPRCRTRPSLRTDPRVADFVARTFAPEEVVHTYVCKNGRCGEVYEIKARAYRKAA